MGVCVAYVYDVAYVMQRLSWQSNLLAESLTWNTAPLETWIGIGYKWCDRSKATNLESGVVVCGGGSCC